MDVQEEAAERYDRLPWDHLVPPPDPDRRRWLVGGVLVVVLGAFLGFRAGSGSAAAPPPPEATLAVDATVPPDPAPIPDPIPELDAPMSAPVAPPPVLSASVGPTETAGSTAITSGVQRAVTEAFAGPGVFVDGVLVHGDGAGGHVAVVSLYEVVDGAYVRVPEVAVSVGAHLEGATVVIDELVPVPVPEVRLAEPLGAVDAVPDPVVDAFTEALTVWPGSEVLRAGNDTGGWWAEVALRLPGGGSVPLVIRPQLPVGIGSGG